MREGSELVGSLKGGNREEAWREVSTWEEQLEREKVKDKDKDKKKGRRKNWT